MEFLKKNYEKLLLGIVLLGLAVAVGFLPFLIANQKAELERMKEQVRPRVKPLTNLDLTIAEAALKRAATPAMIDFGPPNRLFNPMPWQKQDDQRLIPGSKVGPTALMVTNVRELHLDLTLDQVSVDASGNPTYLIGVEKPAATGTGKVRNQFSCTTNAQNKVFKIIQIKGKPEDPTEIIVELQDTKDQAAIRKGKPFERIEGYMADLRYDPEKKKWDNCREKMRLSPPLAFNGEEYNIAKINKDEITLIAKSNGKKWTIKVNASS